MTIGDYTNRIVDYVLEFDYDNIPDKVVEHTKIIILDTLGAILAASNPKYPASRIITEFVKEQGGREEATIIGRDYKTSSTNAALVNGIMGYMTLHTDRTHISLVYWLTLLLNICIFSNTHLIQQGRYLPSSCL